MVSIPRPLVPDDDGSADASVSAALAAFSAGTADAVQVLTALSTARVLVPVVALLTESEVGAHGIRQEKESEMALPKLIGEDGREAVLAFTGTDSLTRWRPDARPIQATGPQVCRAAVQEQAAAVVVDVAGPVPFVIEGTLLQALAAMDGPPETLAARLSGTGVTVARLAPTPPPRRRFPWLRRPR
ncbi:hypothetical protein HNP84_000824 [Thermocatellispora tengchongensis]|uniref:SseB protein N-terminal domain-containing protein n=1 Tax=Thermocatellispora tengchongensis TaxID=1073253 RepID=A0A840NU77_9ACTN|nr:SseB family protein [Thermocatellispora tengchongensis]MBB5131118.1 hypothetical protein [Thermocatellispora tengchongensis]